MSNSKTSWGLLHDPNMLKKVYSIIGASPTCDFKIQTSKIDGT